MTFLEKITVLCLQEGISPSALCEKIGVTRSAYARWRQGQIPRNQTMKAIADFFGVTLKSLKDDTRDIEYTSAPTQQEAAGLSKQEEELLNIYRNLSLSGQLKLIQTALELRNE